MPTIVIALIVIGIAPFAIYLALKRPLLFPFGLYVALVPFDPVIGGSKITLIVAIVTAGALIFNMLITRRVLAPPRSWTGWALYTLLASLTALWTIDSVATMNAVGTLLQLFVFFTIVSTYPAERRDVIIIASIIVVSGTVFALCGLAGWFEGFRFQGGGTDRLTIYFQGTMLDPNHFGSIMLLPIALAVGTLLEKRNFWLRFGSAAATVVMVAALFLTGSRGALIALAVMLLYIAWKTRYRLQILAIMAFAGAASLLSPNVWARFADNKLGAGSGRLFIWNAAELALKDHWLAGAGLGSFPAAYNHELLAMYQPVFQGWSRPAHNAVISAAVELGILGAALLVHGAWRSWNDSRGNVVIEAAIVGLAVTSFFLDVMLFKYIWLGLTMAVLVKNASDPHFLRGVQRQAKQTPGSRIMARRFERRQQKITATNAAREKIASNL